MKKHSPETSNELFSDSFQTDVPSKKLSSDAPSYSPLAARMRPSDLSEISGQQHLLGEGKLLWRVLKADKLSSVILYGPAGSGKTTLASVISRMTSSFFVSVNAVSSNVAELRNIVQTAKKRRDFENKRTILFIDEIHRFNKTQQDSLMPDVESGNIILIGATTQNPSFAINSPLLSRSLVCELRPLDEEDLISVMRRAIKDSSKGLGKEKIDISDEALSYIAKQSSGDARRALNALEIGVLTTHPDSKGVINFDISVASESCQKKIVRYDTDEDNHYDTISAFIKSLRGGDVQASLYWLAKMLHAGEDTRFIMRRLLIFASEDIGNADPQALILSASAMQALEFVGMPEGRIILSQAVVYLALAPKSNACYKAIELALDEIKSGRIEEVPNHLTGIMH